jgi:hypothetical protein
MIFKNLLKLVEKSVTFFSLHNLMINCGNFLFFYINIEEFIILLKMVLYCISRTGVFLEKKYLIVMEFCMQMSFVLSIAGRLLFFFLAFYFFIIMARNLLVFFDEMEEDIISIVIKLSLLIFIPFLGFLFLEQKDFLFISFSEILISFLLLVFVINMIVVTGFILIRVCLVLLLFVLILILIVSIPISFENVINNMYTIPIVDVITIVPEVYIPEITEITKEAADILNMKEIKETEELILRLRSYIGVIVITKLLQDILFNMIYFYLFGYG